MNRKRLVSGLIALISVGASIWLSTKGISIPPEAIQHTLNPVEIRDSK